MLAAQREGAASWGSRSRAPACTAAQPSAARAVYRVRVTAAGGEHLPRETLFCKHGCPNSCLAHPVPIWGGLPKPVGRRTSTESKFNKMRGTSQCYLHLVNPSAAHLLQTLPLWRRHTRCDRRSVYTPQPPGTPSTEVTPSAWCMAPMAPPRVTASCV